MAEVLLIIHAITDSQIATHTKEEDTQPSNVKSVVAQDGR